MLIPRADGRALQKAGAAIKRMASDLAGTRDNLRALTWRVGLAVVVGVGLTVVVLLH